MNRHAIPCIALFVIVLSQVVRSQSVNSEAYLTWSASQAETIAKSTRATGQAGGSFDTRIISTNNAINYQIRATLMTPEVIRGSVRYVQLMNRLSDDETRRLVKEADDVAHLVVIVEINPNEGSGVIPLDWRVFLQPKVSKSDSKVAITGVKSPQLRKMVGMHGNLKRNYEYDIFWVAFPLVDENKVPLIPIDTPEIQLVVGIYTKEGIVTWRMPESIRAKIKSLSEK